MKDLNKLNFEQLKKEVEKLEHQKKKAATKQKGVWHIGMDYVIRTVTMIQVGKLIEVTDNEILLENAAWVGDTGRWAEFLSKGKVNEVEPFPDGIIIVGRHSVIDACIWQHGSLRETK